MAQWLQQITANFVVGGLSVFALALGFFAISYLNRRRQMLHQERMASLIKGLHYAGVAKEVFQKQQVGARDFLFRGLRWVLGALGLSGTVGGYESLQPSADWTSIIRGALVGLIPLAIGLANLLFSWLSYRRDRAARLPRLPLPLGRSLTRRA
jgi:hypothetical protein